MIINIQSYGDFDIPVTYCLMEINDISKSDIKSILSELEHRYGSTREVDGIIKDLKRLGATVVKSYDCTVGGMT